MGAALSHHNYDEFTRLNRQFHFVIYDAAGSKYLSRMITGLWELAERLCDARDGSMTGMSYPLDGLGAHPPRPRIAAIIRDPLLRR